MHDMICLAAGDGRLEVMAILLSWDARRQLQTLTTALAIGALNGHEEICAYLIFQGAGPANSVRVPGKSRLATKGRRVLALGVFSDRKTIASGSDSGTDSDDGSENGSRSIPFEREAVKHDDDAVQLCLTADDGRFQREYERHRRSSKFDCGPPRHARDEAAQTRTLRILVDGIVGFHERNWSRKVCTAAQFCPPAALEILLQKDVRGLSATRNDKALQAAVMRKHWSYSIMQLLLQAGADLEEFDLRTLLASSLAQFDQRSLFPEAQSLEELFGSGCGAAVEYLLSRLPREDSKRQRVCCVTGDCCCRRKAWTG